MNLQPVNFKAVAAKGAYVYCYLRADGSPYYVGIASTAVRPFERHNCGVPRKHPERVRIMRSGLSWEEACQWEATYIARYGRKDIGTGILHNRTDGGDGIVGYRHTEETKQHMRRLMTGRAAPWAEKPCPPERRIKISEAQKGKIIPQEQRAAISKTLTGRTQSEETRAKRNEAMKEVFSCQETIRRMSESAIEYNKKPGVKTRKSNQAKAAWAKPGERAKRAAAITAGKAARKAAEFGFTVEEWMSFTKDQRTKAGEVLPKAQALGYSLPEWWALPRSTKITLLSQLRAA